MKITIENYGKTSFVDLGHDDISAEELVETFHAMMHLLGYHNETIKEAFKEYAKELN